jgi:hypothetical protein
VPMATASRRSDATGRRRAMDGSAAARTEDDGRADGANGRKSRDHVPNEYGLASTSGEPVPRQACGRLLFCDSEMERDPCLLREAPCRRRRAMRNPFR